MFEIAVNNEIKLKLINEFFAKEYATIVEENCEYLARWLAWPSFCKTEEDFKAFFKKSLHDYADSKSMVCAIFYRGNIVGNISFNSINYELKVVEIGYWIADKFQGKGIITNSCSFLIDYAFTILRIQKVQISVAEENIASRAVCERLGLKLEGIITNKEKVRNKILNHAVYGIHRK
ncbi:GNAT family N-acetyltransferase [Francisellaceae bacterium CB300]